MSPFDDDRRGPGPAARATTLLAAAGVLLAPSPVPALRRFFRRATAPDPHGEAAGRGAPSVPPSPDAKAHGFETVEMDARRAGLALATLAATAVAMVGLMFLLLHLLHAGDAAREAGFTAEERARVEPPAPRLQSHPMSDLREVQARERSALDAYGWLDAGCTRARIPIDRAMALTVGRSLDAGPEPAPAEQAADQPPPSETATRPPPSGAVTKR